MGKTSCRRLTQGSPKNRRLSRRILSNINILFTIFNKQFIDSRYIIGDEGKYVKTSLVIRRAAGRVRRAATSHHSALADGRSNSGPAGGVERAVDHGGIQTVYFAPRRAADHGLAQDCSFPPGRAPAT